MAASLAPFAASEARLNAAVQRRLANSVATWQGGAQFGVIFEQQPHGELGVSVFTASCSFPVLSVPGLDQGGVLVIDGREWTVIEPVIADSAGWATVPLREGGNG